MVCVCNTLPCDCPVWNQQEELIWNYLLESPIEPEQVKKLSSLIHDPEFMGTYNSISQPEALESPFYCWRLAARINGIMKKIQKHRLAFRIEACSIPGTHGIKRYFLVDLRFEKSLVG